MRQHSTTASQLAARLLSSIPLCKQRFAALLPSILQKAGTHHRLIGPFAVLGYKWFNEPELLIFLQKYIG